MQKPITGLKSAVSALPKPVIDTPRREEEAQEKPKTGREGFKKQTLYLPDAVYEQLRELAFTSRVSQQEVFRRALNLYFAESGLPSWDELAPPKKGGGKR